MSTETVAGPGMLEIVAIVGAVTGALAATYYVTDWIHAKYDARRDDIRFALSVALYAASFTGAVLFIALAPRPLAGVLIQ